MDQRILSLPFFSTVGTAQSNVLLACEDGTKVQGTPWISPLEARDKNFLLVPTFLFFYVRENGLTVPGTKAGVVAALRS